MPLVSEFLCLASSIKVHLEFDFVIDSSKAVIGLGPLRFPRRCRRRFPEPLRWLGRRAGRVRCHIAMNGDPTKPAIAAAQAYFLVQTHRMEIEEQRSADQQRLDMRNKVTESFKRIAGVAQDAGVVRQAIFHDARYRGLYGLPMREVKKRKGIKDKENLLDRAGSMELSANDFQMNLAAEVIATKGIKGEPEAIALNQRIGHEVRETMRKEGATLPENLPVEPPISEVRKRLAKVSKAAVEKKSSDPSTGS